jgi:hypothetical protein
MIEEIVTYLSTTASGSATSIVERMVNQTPSLINSQNYRTPSKTHKSINRQNQSTTRKLGNPQGP